MQLFVEENSCQKATSSEVVEVQGEKGEVQQHGKQVRRMSLTGSSDGQRGPLAVAFKQEPLAEDYTGPFTAITMLGYFININGTVLVQ